MSTYYDFSWDELEHEPEELSCPPGVRSCYECNRPASRCPQEQEDEA